MNVPHIIADRTFTEVPVPEAELLIESASNPILLLSCELGSAKEENNMKKRMRTMANIIIIKGDTAEKTGCCEYTNFASAGVVVLEVVELSWEVDESSLSSELV